MRKSIPRATRHEVLMEAGYMCANPRCRHILTLEVHHIVWVRDGGGDEPDNLLALCPNCHALHTKGEIPQDAIRYWKGMLVALNEAVGRRGMDLLLLLHKGPSEAYYTADAMVDFAGLIAADLVEVGFGGAGGPNPPIHARPSVYQLKLSDRGKVLVEAWLEGDEDGYRKPLEQGIPPEIAGNAEEN